MELSGASKEEDPASSIVRVTQWLSKNIHSQQGIQLMSAMSVMDTATKSKILEREAEKYGILECPLTDGSK